LSICSATFWFTALSSQEGPKFGNNYWRFDFQEGSPIGRGHASDLRMQGIRQKLSQFVTPHWTQQKSQRRAAQNLTCRPPLRIEQSDLDRMEIF